MVVDDTDPGHWYKRMLAVGFAEGGYFTDCESAIEALETGDYDVILTDLDLGEGKMGGIEFVKKAYDIQESRRKKPMIAVFSYDDQKLKEADMKLRTFPEPKTMNQSTSNNKTNFIATDLRTDVSAIVAFARNRHD